MEGSESGLAANSGRDRERNPLAGTILKVKGVQKRGGIKQRRTWESTPLTKGKGSLVGPHLLFLILPKGEDERKT